MLIVSAPIIAVLALAVKLSSSGPAFYKQVRVGKNGRIYSMYKLRSMYKDCKRNSGTVWSRPGDRAYPRRALAPRYASG